MTQGATANDKRQVLQICRQTHHHWPHDLSLTPKIPTPAFDMRITKEISPRAGEIFSYYYRLHQQCTLRFLEFPRSYKAFCRKKKEYMLPAKLPFLTNLKSKHTIFHSILFSCSSSSIGSRPELSKHFFWLGWNSTYGLKSRIPSNSVMGQTILIEVLIFS